MKIRLAAGFLLLPLIASCTMLDGDPDSVAIDQSGNRIVSGALRVQVSKITAEGVGQQIGTLLLMDSRSGLRIEAALGNLPPGTHGLHIHEKGDCGSGMKDGKVQAGIAAGSHYDPAATGRHAGPMGDGHKGDLPVLEVDQDGNATGMVSALHLSVADVRGRAIIIHSGGDNFSDQPKPLGGGGERIACGVVPQAE
ncbi:MAG: superoxide dismutase [Cu-Zn] SodC [Micropepsaceae bacterium]